MEDGARAAGLHPNDATPLFRPKSGVTIRGYRLQHRLTRGATAADEADRKVLDIALASGCGSLSAFYEAFGGAGLETPQVFRKRVKPE